MILNKSLVNSIDFHIVIKKSIKNILILNIIGIIICILDSEFRWLFRYTPPDQSYYGYDSLEIEYSKVLNPIYVCSILSIIRIINMIVCFTSAYLTYRWFVTEYNQIIKSTQYSHL
jgi:hypothetical protein